MKKDISVLLEKVNKAFGLQNKPAGLTYVYYIGPIGGGWQFTVTDNWYRWSDCKYMHDFYGKTVQGAIESFLSYIKINNINPAELRH